MIEDASDRFLPPNTLVTSTRIRLLSAYRHPDSHPGRVRDEFTLIETEESNGSRRSKRFSGPPGRVGSFLPVTCPDFVFFAIGDQLLTSLSHLSRRLVRFFSVL